VCVCVCVQNTPPNFEISMCAVPCVCVCVYLCVCACVCGFLSSPLPSLSHARRRVREERAFMRAHNTPLQRPKPADPGARGRARPSVGGEGGTNSMVAADDSHLAMHTRQTDRDTETEAERGGRGGEGGGGAEGGKRGAECGKEKALQKPLPGGAGEGRETPSKEGARGGGAGGELVARKGIGAASGDPVRKKSVPVYRKVCPSYVICPRYVPYMSSVPYCFR